MDASPCRAVVEIRPSFRLGSNSLYRRTPLGGQFDWGGRLQKSNGGSSRYPHSDWQPGAECNGIRVLDWETYTSIRLETRA